ncbi:MAG: hypothetical protein N4A45_08115 [Flavobacteriales bacterium]|jgi:hypothetical protein|nr:hypothetical protein [Flavobacteriales bacterium]
MKNILFGFLTALLFVSCENDLEIFSEKDTPTYVYGILNPLEKEHFVVVQKTLKKNALKDITFDELYYGDDEASVNVIVTNADGQKTVHELDPIILDSSNPDYPKLTKKKVYKWDYVVQSFTNGDSYQLEVTFSDPNKEKIFNKIPFKFVKRATIDEPSNLKFGVLDFGLITPQLETPLNITWKQSGVGRSFLYINLGYVERNTLTNEVDTIISQVPLYNKVVFSEEKVAKLQLIDVQRALEKDLTEKPNVERELLGVKLNQQSKVMTYCLGFDFWAYSPVLSSYQDIVFNENALNQDNPDFTNLENGVGVFSFRQNFSYDVRAERIGLNEYTVKKILCNEQYKKYNFGIPKKKLGTNQFEIDFSADRCNQ